jgi:hypothetical protein
MATVRVRESGRIRSADSGGVLYIANVVAHLMLGMAAVAAVIWLLRSSERICCLFRVGLCHNTSGIYCYVPAFCPTPEPAANPRSSIVYSEQASVRICPAQSVFVNCGPLEDRCTAESGKG